MQWQAREIVPDRNRLLAPDDLTPGAYHLFAGMHDEATGERSPLALVGERLKGDKVGLTDISVD